MIKKLLQNLDTKYLEPLSGMDATFLYGESPTSPMHVGSVAIIEGAVAFEQFKKVIASRLHNMPILRKRLVNVPFSVDYPYLADDPNFDLDLHMHHVALPQPADWKQLRALASDVFSQPMDLNKPLWSITFVEGLNKLSQVPKNSVAVISKVHHAVVDGVAGTSLLSIMFDMTKKVKKIPEPKPYDPKPLPNDATLITKSVLNFAKQPLRFPKIISSAVKSTVRAGMLTRVQHLEPPASAFSAPRTPINGIISAQRKWNTTILDLARVKALKKIMGVTLNDMALAICAGALRRYLDEKEALPSKPLVALVPVSVRAKTDTATQGNEISAMLVQLATDIDDPIERVEKIYGNTTRSKTYQGALGAKAISNLGEVIPFGIANQAAKIYSRYNLARMHNPVFNLVITNVPGPQFPMYVQGNKVHSVMGTAPLIDGMGLMIVIFSYNGKITITVTSDEKSMPDLDVFSNYIRDSANEMEKVVHDFEKKGKQKKKKVKKKKKAESDLLFEKVKAFLKKNPKFLRPDSGIYQFNVNGGTTAEWQVNFSKAPGSIRRGKAKNPDATLTIKDEHLAKIGRGEMKLQTAMIQGRLKVDGDYDRALQLGKILMKILNEQK